MTQKQAVLNHLLSGKELSSIEAISLYGATRLGAIIFNLKKVMQWFIGENGVNTVFSKKNGKILKPNRFKHA